MLLRPPSSTRTATLLPHSTLFRSHFRFMSVMELMPWRSVHTASGSIDGSKDNVHFFARSRKRGRAVACRDVRLHDKSGNRQQAAFKGRHRSIGWRGAGDRCGRGHRGQEPGGRNDKQRGKGGGGE